MQLELLKVPKPKKKKKSWATNKNNSGLSPYSVYVAPEKKQWL